MKKSKVTNDSLPTISPETNERMTKPTINPRQKALLPPILQPPALFKRKLNKKATPKTIYLYRKRDIGQLSKSYRKEITS